MISFTTFSVSSRLASAIFSPAVMSLTYCFTSSGFLSTKSFRHASTMCTMFGTASASANSLRMPPLASARAANGCTMLVASTRPVRSASSESENETSTSLMSFSGSTPCFFSIRANGPCVPPPMMLMPTVLPFRSSTFLIGESSFTAQ